jgi:hypothetical protein
MLEGEIEAITRAAIDAAKNGDMAAIRLIMDRMLPPARCRPISIDIPAITDAASISSAHPSKCVRGRRSARIIAPYRSHIRFRDPPCPGGQVGVGVGPTLDVYRSIYKQGRRFGLSVSLYR